MKLFRKMPNTNFYTFLSNVLTFSFKGIFAKTFLIVFALILFIVLISLNIFSTQLSNIFKNEVESYNTTALIQLAETSDNVINTCENIATTISSKTSADIFMNSEKYNLLYTDLGTIRTEIRSFLTTYTYIDSIYLYSRKSDAIVCEPDSSNSSVFEWFEYDSHISTPKVSIYPQLKYNNFPPVITVLKPFFDYSEEHCIGFIAVNLNMNKLSKLIESGQSFNMLYLIDSQGDVIYSNDKQSLFKNARELSRLAPFYRQSEGYAGKHTDEDGELAVNIKASKYMDMKYISFSDTNYYEDMKNKTFSYLLRCALILVLLGLLLSVFVSWNIYRPFSRITDMFSVVYGKKLSKEIGESEFILSNIAKTLDENNELSSQLEERFKLLNQANFLALQSQINPHFLFNTIDNIRWLSIAQTGETNPVSDSLFSLANLLRISANYNNYIVTVKEEIEYSKEYVKLMKLRFNDRFDCIWNISENMLEFKIIKMCLQPIIENAFSHGIKPCGKKGLINICGIVSGENIIFTVTDDGVGMKNSDIQELNKVLAENNLSNAEHIGLNNINQRIKLLFGDNYGISLSSRNDGQQGLTVTVKIPIQ